MPHENDEPNKYLAADQTDSYGDDAPRNDFSSLTEEGRGAQPGANDSSEEVPTNQQITPEGPLEGQTLPPVTVVGPPDFVLANPDLLPIWEDMQDGSDAAQFGVPPDGFRSDAFWAGWRGYVDSHPDYDGPALDVAPPFSVPYTDAEEGIIEYLNHHHPPHTETPTEKDHPRSFPIELRL